MKKRRLMSFFLLQSWLDHNLGTVLDGLEGEGLKEDTVVLLHGDHGWQLGEHDSWHKFTKYAAYTYSTMRLCLIVKIDPFHREFSPMLGLFLRIN